MRAMSILAVVVAAGAANAADTQTENRPREALRQTTAQLRSLEDEKARLQASEAAQKSEIESLKAQLEAETSKARGAPPDLKRRLEEAAESNQKLTADLAQCQESSRETAEAAKAKEEEREQLQTKQTEQLSQATTRVTVCEEKNERMFKLSHELVQKCESMSFGDSLAGIFEPLTGLRKAQLERLAQDYDDKLLEQKAHQ